jgi:hypothetical protein
VNRRMRPHPETITPSRSISSRSPETRASDRLPAGYLQNLNSVAVELVDGLQFNADPGSGRSH